MGGPKSEAVTIVALSRSRPTTKPLPRTGVPLRVPEIRTRAEENAARLGLGCTLVLGGEEPVGVRGNALLNQLSGAGDPTGPTGPNSTAARAEHTRVSVTSLCIASGVPPTTALRWIGQMTEAGLLERVEDDSDRRRAFIQLADKAADAMARYFAELAKDAKSLV